MRVLGVALILFAGGAACAEAEPAGLRTDLTITVWAQGQDAGGARRWTLRCGPAGGSLPRAARACTSLAGVRNPFRPIPKDTVCTEIYGGPQEALVRGTHAGGRVWARFNRTDGCQIDRWNRIRFLFPVPLGPT